MRDLQAIADRVEIEALRGEFTDAVMVRDYDRLASLLTQDGAVRMPHVNAEAVSAGRRSAPGSSGCRAVGLLRANHAPRGTIQLASDTAAGRAHIAALGRVRGGKSHLSYAVYHDRSRRTPDGWRVTERVHEVRYLDPAPLAGSAPHAAASAH